MKLTSISLCRSCKSVDMDKGKLFISPKIMRERSGKCVQEFDSCGRQIHDSVMVDDTAWRYVMRFWLWLRIPITGFNVSCCCSVLCTSTICWWYEEVLVLIIASGYRALSSSQFLLEPASCRKTVGKEHVPWSCNTITRIWWILPLHWQRQAFCCVELK